VAREPGRWGGGGVTHVAGSRVAVESDDARFVILFYDYYM
jgi:hypothetical protein